MRKLFPVQQIFELSVEVLKKTAMSVTCEHICPISKDSTNMCSVATYTSNHTAMRPRTARAQNASPHLGCRRGCIFNQARCMPRLDVAGDRMRRNHKLLAGLRTHHSASSTHETMCSRLCAGTGSKAQQWEVTATKGSPIGALTGTLATRVLRARWRTCCDGPRARREGARHMKRHALYGVLTRVGKKNNGDDKRCVDRVRW